MAVYIVRYIPAEYNYIIFFILLQARHTAGITNVMPIPIVQLSSSFS